MGLCVGWNSKSYYTEKIINRTPNWHPGTPCKNITICSIPWWITETLREFKEKIRNKFLKYRCFLWLVGWFMEVLWYFHRLALWYFPAEPVKSNKHCDVVYWGIADAVGSIYLADSWATVCPNNWIHPKGQERCLELHYSKAAVQSGNFHYNARITTS